jgi:hypothetical protein
MKKDWFLPQTLSERLGRGEVNNREGSHLLLANTIFWSLLYYAPINVANPPWTLLSIYEGIVVVVIVVLGLLKCYDASGGDENSHFIFDFTCLNFSIGLWSYIFVWSIYRAIDYGYQTGVLKIAVDNYQFAKNLASLGGSFLWLITFLAVIAFQILYFRWMASSLKQVKSARGILK